MSLHYFFLSFRIGAYWYLSQKVICHLLDQVGIYMADFVTLVLSPVSPIFASLKNTLNGTTDRLPGSFEGSNE